jgi:hypothetical protein
VTATAYRNDVTAERLKMLCHFDRETGHFVWKYRKSNESRSAFFNSRYAGRVAGRSNAKGYIYLRIDGVNYAAHRLAWLYCYGSFPKHEIDHKNRNRSDNRIENLRDVTSSENKFNRPPRNGKGVCFNKRARRFYAYVYRGGGRVHIGTFMTEQAALAARKHFLAAA